MPTSPTLIIFDVNETLSDMSTLAQRFGAVGAPSHLATLWFATVLRDGFALTAAGANEDFATLAEQNLRQLLAGELLDRGIDDAVAEVMSGFGGLDVHPDVPDGLRALHRAGKRLVTLSNGATAVADGLLSRAGVRDLFEQLLSVQDADRWKPASEAYAYGLAACGVDAGEAMLAAVHPWDIDGARRCGLRTAWINRSGRPYPTSFTPPEVTVDSVTALALALAA
ncbi:haloacid dehalogenase type II [Promicromonospora sp. NPDC023987]|uniref:haloacid dehalogenase type II n=1 Tax=Promicromonospora sp. NPDC023987 TaxID=3155360 RepID=UPI0033EA50C8